MKLNTFFGTILITGGLIATSSSGIFAASESDKNVSVQKIESASKNVIGSGKAKTASPEREILFFLNPNGRPCQIQISILDAMKEKLDPLAKVTYIKTTELSHQNLFYKYGIRGLPMLIVLDKNGKETKRFTPGIQDEKTILSALEK